MILHHSYYSLFSDLLLAVVLLLIISVYITIRARDKAGFSRLSLYMKLIMVAGMLTLVATWFRNLS